MAATVEWIRRCSVITHKYNISISTAHCLYQSRLGPYDIDRTWWQAKIQASKHECTVSDLNSNDLKWKIWNVWSNRTSQIAKITTALEITHSEAVCLSSSHGQLEQGVSIQCYDTYSKTILTDNKAAIIK